jgi:hypothetical protein
MGSLVFFSDPDRDVEAVDSSAGHSHAMTATYDPAKAQDRDL